MSNSGVVHSVSTVIAVSLLAICSAIPAASEAEGAVSYFRMVPPGQSEARVVVKGDTLLVEVMAPAPDTADAGASATCYAVFAGQYDPADPSALFDLEARAFITPDGITIVPVAEPDRTPNVIEASWSAKDQLTLRGAAAHCGLNAPIGGDYDRISAPQSDAFADCPERAEPCWAASGSTDAAPDPGSAQLSDLFMNAPQDIVPLLEAERRALLDPASGRLVALEPASGFLSISGDAGLPGFTLRVLGETVGGQIVALQRIYSVAQQTVFYEVGHDRELWRDISIEIVPDYDRELGYRLAPIGARSIVQDTPIRVYDETRAEHIATLTWQDGQLRLAD